jgi:hypothetical protein
MTLVPFTPSATSAPPFSTLVTLDGQSYSLSTAWNLYRGDWYFSLTDQSGNLLVNQPLIASPPDSDIYLAPGLFSASTLVYRANTGVFEVGP